MFCTQIQGRVSGQPINVKFYTPHFHGLLSVTLLAYLRNRLRPTITIPCCFASYLVLRVRNDVVMGGFAL